jgi:hypothetical protein
VHAFPNILVDGDTLPVALSDLKTVHMDVKWTYGVGKDPSPTTDDATLKSENLNANVAIDMFLDSDETVSSNSSLAQYEIMIWFAQYGDSTDPIGYNTSLPNNGIKSTRTLNGTDLFVSPFRSFPPRNTNNHVFSHLYTGKNTQQQNVLTYIAATTTESFSGELQELLTLPSSGVDASEFPKDTDYLGHFSFGSEAFYSLKNVTFHVPTFAIDIRT